MKILAFSLQSAAIALVATSLFSCGGNARNEPNNLPATEAVQSQPPVTQGRGTITLTCNGKAIVTEGNCNYSPHATCIVVGDDANAANAFTISLGGPLPEQTTVYNLVSGGGAGNGKACMSFTRFPSAAKMINWESDAKSGSLTLTVEGNKISGTFNNIALKPAQFYNPDSLQATGICSGSFTLYR